ncbi:hypothetical protein AJ80_05002 [Polytolypa hystricis UAMH7299]|uniref:Uncharacterized protein n=1 Tax=Polytolypa hystricis (strain UAMH7299) TaxID=1447883 RepID=A0A2B7XYQ9_POLH7|nr:hypothetical protein AJ80_05002 [Polytolypa hystricis UAMH7299]
MLSRRIAAAARLPCRATTHKALPHPGASQVRFVSQANIEDPGMNGGYVNPPSQKRQFRDPYGEWWDKQDRRNFGEPVHEDNDILGTFSTEPYTHFTPGKGLVGIGLSVSAVLLLSGVVYLTYPDRPSAARTFPDGLDKELGGPNTVLVSVAIQIGFPYK